MTLKQTRHRVAVFIPSNATVHATVYVVPCSAVLETDGLEVSADFHEQRLWFSTTSCSSLIPLDECGPGQHVLDLKFLPSREEEESNNTAIR
jgi:hypothetical protein